VPFQAVFDDFALELVHCFLESGLRPWRWPIVFCCCNSFRFRIANIEVACLDDNRAIGAVLFCYGLLCSATQQMLQLAYIARPGVVLQRLFRVTGKTQGIHAQTALVIFQEVAGQQQDILAAFA